MKDEIMKLRAVKQPQVTLFEQLGYNPIERIWLAYRTCYSNAQPEALRYGAGLNPSYPEMVEYIERRMKTEHTSPLEQASFQFGISDVSRVFTHQFVRHRAGVSVAQQSGRYTDPLKSSVFSYVEPPSVNDENRVAWTNGMKEVVERYKILRAMGVTEEDARYALPSCQATNMTVTINFAALLHMSDIRLCSLAQKEFRQVVALMRRELYKAHPDIAQYLQPKCGSKRQGFCDEDHAAYKACPLGKVRPHKLAMSDGSDAGMKEYLNDTVLS